MLWQTNNKVGDLLLRLLADCKFGSFPFQETSDIIAQATPKSLVILDEQGRGTSTHDGTGHCFCYAASLY